MIDPIDEYGVQQLKEFGGKKLASTTKAGLDESRRNRGTAKLHIKWKLMLTQFLSRGGIHAPNFGNPPTGSATFRNEVSLQVLSRTGDWSVQVVLFGCLHGSSRFV